MDDASCNIENTPYEVGFSPTTGRVDCEVNPSTCQKQICLCDEKLSFSILEKIDQFNDAYFLKNADFNHEAECVKAPSVNSGGNGACDAQETSDAGSMQCCGEYPERFPFNDKAGCISCCDGKTYNTHKKSCCDNSIKAFGMC